MKGLLPILMLAGCATTPPPAPSDAFFARLGSLCGKAFAGRVVSTDAADADMASKPLVMHVRDCGASEIRIPFHVGEDRSRTWVVSRREILWHSRETSGLSSFLTLKHDHRHSDGTPDVLTDYGGDTGGGGNSRRQNFPADTESRSLFMNKGNPASVANVWTMEIAPARMFAYQLRRPGRHFRVEFDLTRPVPAPPPPWGARPGAG